MQFEWDEAKRQSNLDKHGIDFRLAARIFDGRPIVSFRSAFAAEERTLSVGLVDELFITVIWTWRNDAIRIISARRARDAERRRHRSLHSG